MNDKKSPSSGPDSSSEGVPGDISQVSGGVSKSVKNALHGNKGIPKKEAYEKFPFLEQYDSIFGEDILVYGEGGYAVIVKAIEKKMVYKIPKVGGDRELIKHEINNHNTFAEALQELQSEEKDEIERIPKYIKIPELRNVPDEYKGEMYAMQAIEGQSLNSIYLRYKYKELLQEYPTDIQSRMTDYEIETILKTKGVEQDDIHGNSRELTETLKKIPANMVTLPKGKNGKMISWQEVQVALIMAISGLEEAGCTHHDLHPGNIMFDKEGNVYIIDFGKVDK